MDQTSSKPSSHACLPRYATKRSPERETLGGAVAAAAESFGQPLMPWQRLVADVGLELMPDTGLPAYREIDVTVPRQNGKTTLTLAFEVQRSIGWGQVQRIAYTAQTGKDAREKLLNDQAPLLDPKLPPRLPIKTAVRRVLRGIGNEAIEFKSGSRIFTLASGEDSGHGKVIDLGVIDESFADEDDRREQAMLPAMLTRPAAQILNISTAGTDKSPFLRRKVDAGRAAVAEDRRSGIAYFEWSADEADDIDDPATWWSCMPALGFTITEEVVRHARQTMTEGEFRRAMLNQWTISEERVIPGAVWAAVCSVQVAPDGRMVVAVDVSPDRSSAAVAVADQTGQIELVAHGPGVGWAVSRSVEVAKGIGADIALDTYGPAGNLAAEIEAAGVKVHGYTTRDMAKACSGFYDAVADGRLSVRPHPALDAAVAAVRRRTTGDTWIWGRRDSSEDISPLIAATIAYDKASQPGTNDLWMAYD